MRTACAARASAWTGPISCSPAAPSSRRSGASSRASGCASPTGGCARASWRASWPRTPCRPANRAGAAAAADGAAAPAAEMAREGRTGSRDLKVRVRTARKRSSSSTRWLERQLNDPYVARAKREGYRSRAAYKLVELDDRFRFLKPGAAVVDIGAAPGGWSQVAAERVKAPGKGCVVAIDLLPMDPVPGAEILRMDFMGEGAEEALKRALRGADVVLSDM